ncbi:DUF5615 family PIN-like protein [Iningainema tapete]|uniref:DUF5615 family PIN-like protein n=1 Tax=Iningainema tapete BLCC-T55 TaxID=2748662 RepID=A0A8J6XMC5_9CYAN|nr:DUF5615 family PIN-like protein [Iningainema tapete]MBD2773586.1 DUF5615 family PIN-like protein [Iningainema tapete BLCC-T55]
MSIQYLLDENLPPTFQEQLLRCQPDLIVWMVGDPDAPPKGTLDPEILCWCEEKDFILVTRNRRSMPVHLAAHLAANRHIPGILVLRRKATIGQVINDLVLIAAVSKDDDYRDRIDYIPL